MEICILIWLVCAGLSYAIARDRAPSKTGLTTALGFSLGPIGIGITLFLKDDAN